MDIKSIQSEVWTGLKWLRFGNQWLEGSFVSGNETSCSGKLHNNEDVSASQEELHSTQSGVYSLYFLKLKMPFLEVTEVICRKSWFHCIRPFQTGLEMTYRSLALYRWHLSGSCVIVSECRFQLCYTREPYLRENRCSRHQYPTELWRPLGLACFSLVDE